MTTHRKGPAPHRYVHFHIRRPQEQRFRDLSKMPPSAQGLLLWLLGCPFSIRVPGVIVAGRAQIAELLGWPIEAFDACFAELAQKGYCEADWEAGVIYFAEELREEDNAPTSPNTAKTWRGELDNAPQCALVERVVRDVLDVLSAADDRRIRAELAEGNRVGPCWVPAFLRQDAADRGTKKPPKRAGKKPPSRAPSKPSSVASPMPSGNPDPSPDLFSAEHEALGALAARVDDAPPSPPVVRGNEEIQTSRLPPLDLLAERPQKRAQDARSAPQSPAEGLGYCLDPERCLNAVTAHAGALLKHGHLVPSATSTALGPFRMHSKFRQLWGSALREYFEELYTTEADVLRELTHFGKYLAQRGESENLFDLCNWRAERFTRLMVEAHAWDGQGELNPTASRTARRGAADADALPYPYVPAVLGRFKPEECSGGEEALANIKKLFAA